MSTLHPDLAAVVRQHPFFGRIIDHPLVRIMPYLDVPLPYASGDGNFLNMTELANASLAEKRSALERAESERDWRSYAFLHERPYRLDALRDLIDRGRAQLGELWPVVGHVWADSENIYESLDEWVELWRTNCRRKRTVMRKEDRELFRGLPDTITVYRGVNCSDEWEGVEAIESGLSWTLSRKKAIWFARRGTGLPYIAAASVQKRHCFAFFSERKEQEIVVDPDWTTTLEFAKFPGRKR